MLCHPSRSCHPFGDNLQFAICNLQFAILVCLASGHPLVGQENPRGDHASQAKPAIAALAIAPDGKGFVQGSQAGVFVRSFAGNDEQPFPTKLDHVNSLAISPDGTILAIAGGSPAEAGMSELWSWPARKPIGRLEGHEDVVYAVVWLPQQQAIATASADRTIRIWNPITQRCLATLTGHSGPVLALAVSPDGKWLCSASVDQTIRVWDTAAWQLVRSLNNHLGAVHSLAFRPTTEDSRPDYLASSSEDGTVRVWQPAIGRMVRIVGHGMPVYCLAWNSDGSGLYTGAKDGCVRLVAGESDQILRQRKLSDGWITSLAVRSGNEVLVAGTARGETAILTSLGKDERQ
jgi:WD40 repeat protein